MNPDQVTHMERQLNRIEAKLDKVADDHERRLRRLERALYTSGGLGVAALVAAFTALLDGAVN